MADAGNWWKKKRESTKLRVGLVGNSLIKRFEQDTVVHGRG